MLQLTRPETILISGCTGSGKSYFVFRFLKHVNKMMKPPPDKIIYCYGAWQAPFASLKDVEFKEGLPTLEMLSGPEKKLLILDDLMDSDSKFITDLFTKHSHHMNLTVLHLVQNLFHRNHRTISLNAHILVVFKNSRDASQIWHLARQAFPNKSKQVVEAYRDATKKAFGYICFDFRPETSDQFRIRTQIFPDELNFVYV